MSELIPCPLCGCGHQIDIDEEGGVAFVHQNYNWSKDDCILAIQELNYPEEIDEFVRKWNTRPIEDSLRADNKRLRERLTDFENMARNFVNYDAPDYICRMHFEMMLKDNKESEE